MQTSYEKEILLTPSLCDETSRLSLHGVFLLFQDIASEHAEKIGLGGDAMLQRGVFWLTVRTRAAVRERPRMMETIRLQTWMGRFHETDVRSNRYYRMLLGDRVLAEGKTEWAVLRLQDQSVGRIADTGATEDQVFVEDIVCPEPFRRFRPDFSPEEQVDRHKVRASDIDMGRHMNNTAYVRALLDTFSADELSAMGPCELEICFRSPCFDGELLPVFRRKQEDGWMFAMLRPDGKPAVLAQLNDL